MAYVFQSDHVQYVCTCGSLKPISKIYFCRHCLSIRCGYCVRHEVESHYCPNCMENHPTSEVRLKRNKCCNCFDCPCCSQTLSIRAGQVLVKSPAPTGEEDVKPTMKKVYYLCCGLCRWSSRDAGIPDQPCATGSWPDPENPDESRINALNSYIKIQASKEKQQKERKKSKRTYLQFEKFGITSQMARKRAGRPVHSQPQQQSSDEPLPSVASEDVDELLPDIFEKSLDISKVTTLEQRLQHPEVQAEKIYDVRPQRKQLLVKRSQRCRTCEHNVSKPDLSAQSIKFKIQLAAFYHVPQIRIVTYEPLRAEKASELLLKISNPTQHQTQILLLPLDTAIVPTTISATGVKEEIKRENLQMGSESPNLMPSTVRQISVIEEPKPLTISANAKILLPHSSLILPPRDDAAEYDDPGDTHNFQDDPKLVVWRKGNKAVVRLHVTPNESVQEGDSVIVGFVMQYGYVNTIATLEHKTPQKLELKVKTFLNLGNLNSSA